VILFRAIPPRTYLSRTGLKPYLAADEKTITAGLQIHRGHAPNLERTIQRLTFSEVRPDDIADGSDLQRNRRLVAKRYIGSEFNDLRHLNYQRYYGPD